METIVKLDEVLDKLTDWERYVNVRGSITVDKFAMATLILELKDIKNDILELVSDSSIDLKDTE